MNSGTPIVLILILEHESIDLQEGPSPFHFFFESWMKTIVEKTLWRGVEITSWKAKHPRLDPKPPQYLIDFKKPRKFL